MAKKLEKIEDPFGPPRVPAWTEKDRNRVGELQRGVKEISDKRLEAITKARETAGSTATTIPR